MKVMGEFWGIFHKEFAWLFWGLVALGIVWFLMGGANNRTAHEGAYIKPLAPLDTGKTYGKYYEGNVPKKTEELDLPQGPADFIRFIESPIKKAFNI